MNFKLPIFFYLTFNVCFSQNLPPKKPYPFSVKQIHSGHSLTDPLFSNWPGQYLNLIGEINKLPGGQLFDTMVGKSTVPGSNLIWRWENPVGYGSPDARVNIENWELLSITERVPLLYEGGSTAQWYIEGIQEQKKYLSLFVNNAWKNGNRKKGTPTLLWTTWTNIDNSDGPWREMLDFQGMEFERMQDYANQNILPGASPVYIIPGHKMMAKLYDDIQKTKVPGITNIKQFFSDNIHPNELGAYAISLLHYACIFNKSPLGLPNDLILDTNKSQKTPSPALATYLQNMIWDVVTTYERTGIYLNPLAKEISSDNEIVVYPNPVSDELFIERTNQKMSDEIFIYDLMGNIILKTNGEKLNISNIHAGTYILRVGNLTKKIFKY